ncbi:hypothetical protein SLNWT_5299 [Streptomyces albus]|uniref:Uncharacterized protein n=1 Tax=Streptomyces albus (strain ATCC 21838 / DSM 41398 / FERM P-419 / JCM 4703 / NBRC 107858) TaxID=1081613 RepID=A0A0B5F247_STRA4|nr:hypothetical protein SLNWT_5299 [Streptomyces albus]AOU79977.1 hypothetical protein SLNHY_5286 [Streptomyces albus]AYN35694.1 hypothetical protein DUI70_5198 [Streptomyces albus]
MSDGYRGYGEDGHRDPTGEPYELVGYDASGAPVYRRVPDAPPPQDSYDPYGQQQPYADPSPYSHDRSQGQSQGYGYDPYAQDTGPQQPYRPQDFETSGQQGYETSGPRGYEPSGYEQPASQGYEPQGYASPYESQGYAPPSPPSPYEQPSPYAQPGYGQQPAHDPYATGHQGGQGHGAQDPYGPLGDGTGQQPPVPPGDPYAQLGDTGPQPGPGRTGLGEADRIPQQSRRAPAPEHGREGDSGQDGFGPRDGFGGQDEFGERGEEDYRTEQFSFVEEPTEDSEDVIDWLKFTESRTERREEAKRRGRSRRLALICVLVLALLGGGGYLWSAGRIPGLGAGQDEGGAEAAGPQKRNMILVHLHNTKGGGTSTALLVDNTTTGRGSTVLLPNSLAVAGDDGSATTLAKSVDQDGSSGTSEAVDTLLGTRVEGTWRLDTPYLNNLVELVGSIEVTTDTDVPAPKAKKGEAPLVHKGEAQTLSGPMAVAYATYRAPGEQPTAQLERFGQVMQGVLRKLSSDTQGATVTVQSLAQILDPSLPERELGAFLAGLAERAKGGDYETALLPVQDDGTLSREATDGVVEKVLGGTVKAPGKGDALRVGVRGGTGGGEGRDEVESARVSLVNGGFTFVDGGSGQHTGDSQVQYADPARKQQAVEVAKTLGLPASAARKGKVPANADVLVQLGGDYEPPEPD